MEQVIYFHDHIIVILVGVVGLVLVGLLPVGVVDRYTVVDHNLEIIWTVFPIFFLGGVGIFSLHLLYLIDEVGVPGVTVKVVGHQWYWEYEYGDWGGELSFDSYILPKRRLRLLDVDCRMVVPVDVPLRMVITSADVIHAWSLPSGGVKVDSVPGRLNQVSTTFFREGIFVGQCSEICGSNHRFMPILVEVVRLDDFLGWVGVLG